MVSTSTGLVNIYDILGNRELKRRSMIAKSLNY